MGATALSALYAQDVLACEMRPKAKPVADVARKSGIRIAEADRRAQRPAPSYMPIFSRRLILQ
ncbi:hypothetical protein WP12_14210 [Sphingomonas sp. SRS2]|nr:hypothetical protein WP12_14210 [Sphingomonas sp. SRS2]